MLDAADAGSEYWVQRKTSGAKVAPDKLQSLKQLETKIEGYQTKISLFVELLRPRVWPSAIDDISGAVAEFFDALTGGNFGSENRAADPSRAKAVFNSAADFVIKLRQLNPRVTFGFIIMGLLIVGFLGYLIYELRAPLKSQMPSSTKISVNIRSSSVWSEDFGPQAAQAGMTL